MALPGPVSIKHGIGLHLRVGFSAVLFSFMDVHRGDFVEVTRTNPRIGTVGKVLSTWKGRLTIQPFDTDTWEPIGDEIRVYEEHVCPVPSPADLRRHKVRGRERHLANLKVPKGYRESTIREYSALEFFPYRGWDT